MTSLLAVAESGSGVMAAETRDTTAGKQRRRSLFNTAVSEDIDPPLGYFSVIPGTFINKKSKIKSFCSK